jgi:hypothetical protein
VCVLFEKKITVLLGCDACSFVSVVPDFGGSTDRTEIMIAACVL